MRFSSGWLLLGLVACGSDAPVDPSDGLPAPPNGEGMQLDLQVSLQPGQEGTWCRMFVVPDGGIDVGRFEHEYTDVSHHILLYPTFYSASAVTDELITNCDTDENIRQYIIGIVYGSQSKAESAEYPSGVAMKTFGGQVLMLEYHALNATDQVTDAEVRLNLWKTHDPVEAEAGTQFFYNPVIAIEPGQQATARMRCKVPAGTRLLFGLGHMHKRGVKFRSWLTGEGLAEPLPLATADDWNDADTVTYAPEVEVGANQYIEYECEYDNTEDRPIIEGLSAIDNEMCVYLGSYYVPNGARLDYDTEWCRGVGSGVVYGGDQSCSQTVACLDAIDWNGEYDVPRERCLVAGCDGVAAPFEAFADCRWASCADACPSGQIDDPACQTCMATECAAAASACSAHVCGG